MRIWVNKDRTVLVTRIDDDTLQVATREDADAVWGPPVLVVLEAAHRV